MPDDRKRRTTIEPEREDFARIEREHGCLPDDAPDAQCAERYRLAQAAALIRLSTQGGMEDDIR